MVKLIAFLDLDLSFLLINLFDFMLFEFSINSASKLSANLEAKFAEIFISS